MMQQIGTFILGHGVLFLALLIVILLIGMDFLRKSLLGFSEIRPLDAVRLMNHQDAVVLDVRKDDEFTTGHILNALHIPLESLEGRMQELEKYKSRPMIVCCRTGQRSSRACATLHKLGFNAVFKLGGGMPAWLSANLPVSKG